MGQWIDWVEVPEFTADDDWRVQDAEAMAILAAPCLATTPTTLTDGKVAALRAILRQALIRWKTAGSGAVQQQTAGPFSQTIDTSKLRRGMFWPSELEQLRGLCGSGTAGRAFEIDTTHAAPVNAYYWSTPTTVVAL